MTDSLLIEAILSSVTASGLLTGGLVFLSKSVISERLKGAIKAEYDQKLESHKAQLKSASDTEIERLKSQLNIAAHERNITFSQLQTKRADVIAETYSYLQDLFDAVTDYIKVFRVSGERSQEEKHKDIVKFHDALMGYFPKKQIFLPKSTAEKIHTIITDLRGAINHYVLMFEMPSGVNKSNVHIEVYSKVNTKISTALDELRDELRLLLGDKE